MPYLHPERILEEFSSYAVEAVRPAIPADEAFMRGQVGSMASTMRFLAAELAGVDDAVADQRASLLSALADAEGAVDDPAVRETLADARRRVAESAGRPREVERVLLSAADEALGAVDSLDEPAAREARAPLYRFLDDRLDAQLGLLGRPADG